MILYLEMIGKVYNKSMTKKTISIYILSFLFLLFLTLLRMIYVDGHRFLEGFVIIGYLGSIIFWTIMNEHRIMHSKIKKYLRWTSILMLFWIIVRLIKYDFIPTDMAVMTRLLWYCFYIPLTLIPLLSFFATKYIGRDKNYSLPKKYYILQIVSIILISGVLTNELHQKAFVLDSSYLTSFYNGKYTYGPIYWMVATWILVLVIFMLTGLYKSCQVKETKQRIWLPIAIVFVGIFYAVGYALFHEWFQIMEMTPTFCWLIMMVWEGCIQSGLVPSNTMYEEMFSNATLSMEITNEEYEECISSKKGIHLPESVLRYSQSGNYAIDHRTNLRNAAIHGGHMLWLEDVFTMNNLLNESQKLQDYLSENNDLLAAENTLKKRSERVRLQNEIYDLVFAAIKDSVRDLETILKSSHTNETLSKASAIGAYIKRRSNLVLLSKNDGEIDAFELEFCFRESLDYLKLSNTLCSMSSKCEGKILSSWAALTYDFFERVVESFPDSLLIHLEVVKHSIYLRLVLEKKLALNFDEFIPAHIEQKEEEGTVYVTFSLEEKDL